MRFLTVSEQLPRRTFQTWYKDWLLRVDLLKQACVIPAQHEEYIPRLYNEGTLLLYRLGNPRLAKLNCQFALELRRLSEKIVPRSFLLQQWINIARLEGSKQNWRSVEKRLQLLSRYLSCGSMHIEDPIYCKTSTICLVERLAIILSKGAAEEVAILLSAVPESIKKTVWPCALETEVRCLVKKGLVSEARRKIEKNLPSSCDELCLALLVLKSNVDVLTPRESKALKSILRLQIKQFPAHAVQVGEYLFKHSKEENYPLLKTLLVGLLKTSLSIGDALGVRYFLQQLGRANNPVKENDPHLEYTIQALDLENYIPDEASGTIHIRLQLLLDKYLWAHKSTPPSNPGIFPHTRLERKHARSIQDLSKSNLSK